jgi:hypothetical protein
LVYPHSLFYELVSKERIMGGSSVSESAGSSQDDRAACRA